MRKTAFVLFSFFILQLHQTFAQAINNMASFRNINSDSYFRLHYENDFFTATDQYYSQGINLEYLHPALKKVTAEKILFHLPNAQSKYGISIEHDAYTPSSIRHLDIIENDRPFAAVLSIKSFLITVDTLNQQRTASSITVGAIGPQAGGEWMQKSIHKWLKNIEPLGWQHQIANDVVLNYQATYEKKLLEVKKYMLLTGYAKVNVGTLTDNAGVGIVIMTGYFHSPFLASNNLTKRENNFQFHFYAQPEINFIAYDATLQGGLFNKHSPYTISAGKISRITFQSNAGVVVSIRKIYLEYFQAIITKEFEAGTYHRWGGVRIGISF